MNGNASPPAAGLTIGQLARRAGVNVETIRYYQRIGLIPKPARPDRGYRRYPAQTVARVHFIKRAQDLGFTLRETAELLSLNDGSCRQARAIAEHKLEKIEAHIADLRAMRHALSSLVEECRRNADAPGHCAIIETLGRR